MEFHTSDLTNACLKAVELRLKGKRIGETASAKFRGSLWHEARALCYARGEWSEHAAFKALTDGASIVIEQAKADNEPLTDAVVANWQNIAAELTPLLVRYGAVVASRVAKLIGCELPIRATFEVDGETIEFASHIDVLFRDGMGNVCMDDDKTQEEVPTRAYLARNMQFAMYAAALESGSVMVDGEWIEFRQWPRLSWIHVNNLRPFGRKTVCKEVDWTTGAIEEVEYAKGDMRPESKIVLGVPIDPSQRAAIEAEFATRVRMARAGLWPTNPDPIGCHLCESRTFCPSFEGSRGAW